MRYEDGQSWPGVLLTSLGAVLGGFVSMGALIAGRFAVSYSKHDFWLGFSAYGCEDAACTSAYTAAALVCAASVAIYAVLVIVAVLTSERMLRAGAWLGLGWTTILIVGGLSAGKDEWLWLVALALPPALMGWGSRMRLRAKQRRRAIAAARRAER